jgi:uncharacterized membrane protein YphA (DoxX/SURF4 family)
VERRSILQFFKKSRPPGDLSIAQMLLRLMVGCVFLSEGIQKFLFPDAVGAGRFVKIGIPWPEFAAPFIGTVEILCGAMLLAGFYARLAAIPLICIMLVAIATTKIPLLLEKGFWAMAHDSRTDWSMLIGSVVILIIGAGRWSLDGVRERISTGNSS